MTAPDPEKLNAFLGKLVGDLGAVTSAALVLLGDRLGIYKAMADGKAITPEQLAEKTGLHGRYLREWLSAQAAAGYIDYNPKSKKFKLNPEQACAFADEGGPAFFAGAFDVAQAMWLDEPTVAEAFRTGKGVGWHEHSHCLFRGTERFFRPGYNAHLVSNWIPSLKGVKEKLEKGAKVADVGCGHGASTILMALAYPKSKFYGFDYHAPSIARAKDWRRKPASPSGSLSKPPAPRIIRRMGTIWWRSSIACTTWAIRSAPASTCATRSHPMAHG